MYICISVCHFVHREARGQPWVGNDICSLLPQSGSWGQTQITRFGDKHLYPQSHLISLVFCFPEDNDSSETSSVYSGIKCDAEGEMSPDCQVFQGELRPRVVGSAARQEGPCANECCRVAVSTALLSHPARRVCEGKEIFNCMSVSLQRDNGDRQHTVLLSGPTLPRAILRLLGLQFCPFLPKLKVLEGWTGEIAFQSLPLPQGKWNIG